MQSFYDHVISFAYPKIKPAKVTKKRAKKRHEHFLFPVKLVEISDRVEARDKEIYQLCFKKRNWKRSIKSHVAIAVGPYMRFWETFFFHRWHILTVYDYFFSWLSKPNNCNHANEKKNHSIESRDNGEEFISHKMLLIIFYSAI